MKKSSISSPPGFFDRYIHLVADIDIVGALQLYSSIPAKEIDILISLGDQKYAENKWTVKDILQHLIDNERIQAYRALRFARRDKNTLPGYDQALYGETAGAGRRTIGDLAEEFEVVRKSSIYLFKSFSEEALMQTGICFNMPLSVLALGYVIAGHQIHHFNIIREKYYPLLKF